jgi:hypothetical protein
MDDDPLSPGAPASAASVVAMRTLLILGSKPDPALPPQAAFDDVACANASGFSAAAHRLPTPCYTVVTAVLASGKKEDEHSLRVMAGLATGTVYYLARPVRQKRLLKRLLHQIETWRLEPAWMRIRLHRLPYRYDHFVCRPSAEMHALMRELCDHDPTIVRSMGEKQPSTGLFTLALAIERGDWDRFVLSGFDFRLTHAYGDSPLVQDRGSTASRHADTDITILGHLAAKLGTVFTTEVAVHERAGVPLLPG